MRDCRDIRHTTDENGDTWLTDKDGRVVHDARGERIPGPARAIVDPASGFTTYDSSQSHCALCGSLTCTGTCFK